MNKRQLIILISVIIVVAAVILTFVLMSNKSCKHIYDNDCDMTCNQCNEERTITHTYDNECDSICNICNETRSITHNYENNCDIDCNICGATRLVNHPDANNDAVCDVCNEVLILDNDNLEQAITAINTFVNSLLTNNRNVFINQENILFSNITTAGSLADEYVFNVDSVLSSDNFTYMTYKNQAIRQSYSLFFDEGYCIIYRDQDVFTMNSHFYNRTLQVPVVTKDDIIINNDLSFSLTNEKAYEILEFWVKSSTPSSWQFGYDTIVNYNELITGGYDLDFDNRFYVTNGKIESSHTTITSDDKSVCSFSFKRENNVIELSSTLNFAAQFSFVLKISNNKAVVNFEQVYNNARKTLTISTDIEYNVAAFVPSELEQEKMNKASTIFKNEAVVQSKYSGPWYSDDTCPTMIIKDEELGRYIEFVRVNNEYYLLSNLNAAIADQCLANCDFVNKTLFVNEHSEMETMDKLLRSIYVDEYTFNGTQTGYWIIGYDEQNNAYIYFEKTESGNYVYSGFSKIMDPHAIIYKIDRVNKIITTP